jgi:hypothetical protein
VTLRLAVLALAAMAMVASLALWVAGLCSGAVVFAIWAALIGIGTLYEKVRYKPLLPGAPGPEWRRTPERFIDPASGQPVTVYVRDGSGERQSVRE